MNRPPSCRGLNFEDVDGIGSGSFSQVARIRDSDRVIKIPSNDAYDHLERERLVYERLKRHPNILRYYGETGITLSGRTKRGLLLHYHEAGTLDKILSAQDSRVSIDRDRWLIQTIEAVRYVHSRGVIHGDLGSHNFLIQSDGALALADFGGSSIDGSECLEFPPPRYSRPTTMNSQYQLRPTEKDDLFGLGTLLYEISTGQLLYQELSDVEINNRFAEQIFPSFTGVPEDLQRVIIGCWTERYENADEVARDLEGAVSRLLRRFSLSSLVYFGLFTATLAVMWSARSSALGLSITRRK
ncbi:CBL-interacting serine/threonine-protein kinase 26 [Tolypocladium ophioglossoides CBS 100239]|uniref:CBL-interacting serine/threonine-protein kinase 26 n=1 Tax=Tolypocladium ophioglossoides (strain CBS 100239) TaxID=1163406 RepID=A0A0L0NIN4_TOLOC|nr:CBL-interacting serine/threonine-protein kinase 26 [Tolypocladium ophioglossoides CBS 100239]